MVAAAVAAAAKLHPAVLQPVAEMHAAETLAANQPAVLQHLAASLAAVLLPDAETHVAMAAAKLPAVLQLVAEMVAVTLAVETAAEMVAARAVAVVDVASDASRCQNCVCRSSKCLS